MKTMEELQRAFEKSFEDHVMTRAERGDLNSSLKENGLTENQKSVLRSSLFDFARSLINAENYDVAINWLEEVTKLLIRNHSETVTDHTSVFFSPGETCRQAIIGLIRSAEQQLLICVFTISDNEITSEIMAARARGVNVQIITDNEKQYDHGSDIFTMRNKGVLVHCDNTPSHMHHKFAVADSKRVLTGSYNWTHSAAHDNQENVLVTDDVTAVKMYSHEFERLWKAFESDGFSTKSSNV